MPGIPAERAQDVREALHVIVSDPGHGPAALSNSQMMSNLLKDLLPDSPREKNLLVAAAEANLAGMMRDHVRQGIDGPSAVRLAAASLGASTHFTDSACTWVATEIAAALDLGAGSADEAGELAAGEIPTARRAGPVAAETRQVGTSAGATAATQAPVIDARQAQVTRPVAEPARARARKAVTPSAVLVIAGALALLGGCVIPVFYTPNPARIWGNNASNSWFVAGAPTAALVLALLCGVLLSAGRSSRIRLAAGGAALAVGAQTLVLYWAIYWQLVKDYGNELGSGILLGLLSAVLLVAGGILELVRQARAGQ